MERVMFTSEDFRIESAADFFQFLPIIFFIVFIAPFLILAYKIGFVMKITGFLD
jgi:hypothetical protein